MVSKAFLDFKRTHDPEEVLEELSEEAKSSYQDNAFSSGNYYI